MFLNVMATNRVRVTGPSTIRKGKLRSKEEKRVAVMCHLKRTLGVATIRAQCLSLIGKLASVHSRPRGHRCCRLEEAARC